MFRLAAIFLLVGTLSAYAADEGRNIDLLDDFVVTVPTACVVEAEVPHGVKCVSNDNRTALYMSYMSPVSSGPNYTQKHLVEIMNDPVKKQKSISAMTSRIHDFVTDINIKNPTFSNKPVDIINLGQVFGIIGFWHGESDDGTKLSFAKIQIWHNAKASEIDMFYLDTDYNEKAFEKVLESVRLQQ